MKIKKADDLWRTPLVDIREVDSGRTIDRNRGECIVGITDPDHVKNCPSANPDYFIFDKLAIPETARPFYKYDEKIGTLVLRDGTEPTDYFGRPNPSIRS